MADEAGRAELHAAIEEAYQNLGAGRLKKAKVIVPFLSRGIGRPTLYRWFDAYTAKSKPGARLAKNAKRAIARERAKGRTEPEAVAIAAGRALEAAPLVRLAAGGAARSMSWPSCGYAWRTPRRWFASPRRRTGR